MGTRHDIPCILAQIKKYFIYNNFLTSPILLFDISNISSVLFLVTIFSKETFFVKPHPAIESVFTVFPFSSNAPNRNVAPWSLN